MCTIFYGVLQITFTKPILDHESKGAIFLKMGNINPKTGKIKQK